METSGARPYDGAMNVMIVGAGGFLGAVARYGLASAIAARAGGSFPWPTLAVNLVGCLALGLVLGLVARAPENPALPLFLATGFLGAFTTFSAFSLDNLRLLESGGGGAAAFNVATQVLIGIAAVWLGRALLA
jgi:fluoride exporter